MPDSTAAILTTPAPSASGIGATQAGNSQPPSSNASSVHQDQYLPSSTVAAVPTQIAQCPITTPGPVGMAERIYIAGPMTGLPAFNRPAFAAAAAHLRSLGLEAINPGELHPHTHLPWSFYMRSALAAMLTCDSILLLNGWTNSRGAKMEFQIADALGMRIYHQESDFVWQEN